MVNFVYCIECKELNKVYIGSTSNLRRRYKEHFNELKNNTHSNKGLQSAYNENCVLRFFVIECVRNKKELLNREQYHIEQNIKNCFNERTVWGDELCTKKQNNHRRFINRCKKYAELERLKKQARKRYYDRFKSPEYIKPKTKGLQER